VNIRESEACELCGREATHEDSVPDARVPGTHPSEAGYRRQFLCLVHAMDRRGVNTARVKEIDRGDNRREA